MCAHTAAQRSWASVSKTCVATAALLAVPLAAQEVVFTDGFESGDTAAWSWTEPPIEPPPPVTALRFSQLALRDPHVYVPIFGFSCADATDSFASGSSVNETLAYGIANDGDADGLLDISLLLLFRPIAVTATTMPVDFRTAECLAPLASTTCSPDTSPPAYLTYDAFDTGTCLEPVSGTLRPYTPTVALPTPPCFVTSPVTIGMPVAGVYVPLVQTRISGAWIGDPPTSVFSGLVMGFLSEAVADSVLLPSGFPIVGGQPLSRVLAGGTGSCAGGDDRDELYPGGDSGWWLYFNFTADEVPWSE